MIVFSVNEIILSAFSALIYGGVFCAFYTVSGILLNLFGSFVELWRKIFIYDRIIERPKHIISDNIKEKGGIYIFSCFAIFIFGFLLLSYVMLDGIIRGYMIILASASFFLLKNAFCYGLTRIIYQIFDCILGFACILVRIITYPFKKVIQIIKNKL